MSQASIFGVNGLLRTRVAARSSGCRRRAFTATAISGALAPNSPLRAAVTALALAATSSPPPAPPAANAEPATEPAHPRAARNTWALLLVRIYVVFPLVCLHCGGAMRIIAFITDPAAGTGERDPHAQAAPEYAFDQRIAW